MEYDELVHYPFGLHGFPMEKADGIRHRLHVLRVQDHGVPETCAARQNAVHIGGRAPGVVGNIFTGNHGIFTTKYRGFL